MNNEMNENAAKEGEINIRNLVLRKGEYIIGIYEVYDVQSSLGIPHRAIIKGAKNYVVDFGWFEPFGIEVEIL